MRGALSDHRGTQTAPYPCDGDAALGRRSPGGTVMCSSSCGRAWGDSLRDAVLLGVLTQPGRLHFPFSEAWAGWVAAALLSLPAEGGNRSQITRPAPRWDSPSLSSARSPLGRYGRRISSCSPFLSPESWPRGASAEQWTDTDSLSSCSKGVEQAPCHPPQEEAGQGVSRAATLRPSDVHAWHQMPQRPHHELVDRVVLAPGSKLRAL